MKKDRLEDLADSLKQIKSALGVIDSIVTDCYPNAYKMDRIEIERKRHQDRANTEAVARDDQNDCLRRLGERIAAGATLLWGDNGEVDYKFYLFDFYGNGIASGGTIQELIAKIPKGE